MLPHLEERIRPILLLSIEFFGPKLLESTFDIRTSILILIELIKPLLPSSFEILALVHLLLLSLLFSLPIFKFRSVICSLFFKSLSHRLSCLLRCVGCVLSLSFDFLSIEIFSKSARFTILLLRLLLVTLFLIIVLRLLFVPLALTLALTFALMRVS